MPSFDIKNLEAIPLPTLMIKRFAPKEALKELERFYNFYLEKCLLNTLLWQVYPEWMTFENYHLIDLMKKTHYAFFILPIGIILPGCWSIDPINTASNFFGILSRSAKQGEDPVMTYKRLTVLDQDIFNDEMFDAWRLFITWEMKRIEKVAGPSANQHNTSLNATEDNGWYRIKKSNCPQDYGYNGIKLQVPKA